MLLPTISSNFALTECIVFLRPRCMEPSKLAVAEENITTQSGKRGGTSNEHFDVVVAQPLSKVGWGQGARR